MDDVPVARSRIGGNAARLLAGAGIVPGQVVALGFEVPGGAQYWTEVTVRGFEQRVTARGTTVSVIVEEKAR